MAFLGWPTAQPTKAWGHSLRTAIESRAAAKLDEALPASVRQTSRESRSLVWVDRGRQPDISRARTVVEHATLLHMVTRLTYVDTNGATTRRDVEPQALAYTRGTWYLLAWCRQRGAPRWFALDRITRADATTEPVTRDCLGEFGDPPPTAEPLEPAGSGQR